MTINKALKNNKNKGFTLVEALVAISILMVAIASPMTLAQKGLSTATMSKDQMIASFLAQDAIEAVRNIRDEIAIGQTSGDWLTGSGVGASLSSCLCSGDTCDFDYESPTYCTIDTTVFDWRDAVKSGVENPGPLNISYTTDNDDTKHFLKYDYTGTEASKFTRYINIKRTSESGDGANEALVHVRVSWSSSSGTQNVDINDFIYNYSENF